MSTYLLGTDILLGADSYADKETVRNVQHAILNLSQAKTDKNLIPLVAEMHAHGGADGVLGGATKAAIAYINKSYRGEPDDGDQITDGLLVALKVGSTKQSVEARKDALAGKKKPKAVASLPVATIATAPGAVAAGNFFTREAWAGGWPWWRVLLVGAAGAALAGGGIALAARKK